VGFLNRVPPPLAVNNARTIGLGSLVPLDVVEYGGSIPRLLSAAASGGTATLAAPTTGYTWRLHRLVMLQQGAPSAGGTGLYGSTTGFFYSAAVFTASTANDTDNFWGQLAPEGLIFINNTTSPINAYLFFDQVLIPVVT